MEEGSSRPSRKRLILQGLLVAGVAIVAIVVWYQRHRPAQVYEGKKLEDWIADLKAPDRDISDPAAQALVHIGPQAVPALVQALQDPDVHLQRQAGRTLEQMGEPAAEALVKLLSSASDPATLLLLRMGPTALGPLREGLDSSALSKQSAHVLGLMGAVAAPAVPELVAKLADRQAGTPVRAEAARALARVTARDTDQRRQAVAALVQAVQDGDPVVRQRAVEALADMEAPDRDSENALLQASKDDNLEVAGAACLTLGRLGRDRALPQLVHVLQGSSERAAGKAIDAFVLLGSRAEAALPRLVRDLAGSQNEMARTRHLFLRLGPIGVPALAAALREDREPAVRRAAAELLGELGPVAEQAVRALQAALKDRDREVALAAARALAAVDPEQGDAAVPVLTRALDDPLTFKALGSLGSKAEKAIPDLITCLQHREGVSNPQEIQLGAQQALARIGPSVIEPLQKALAQRSDGTAARAALVLGSYGPAAAQAVARLLADLKQDRGNGPAYIAALGLIGPPARAALPQLTTLLSDASLRAPAAAALALIAPDQAERAVAALRPDLKVEGKDPEQKTLAAALQAMLYMGPAGRDAIPELVALWRVKSPPLAAAVSQVLHRIGPDAVPTLNSLLRDADPGVREAAAQVLETLGPQAEPAVRSLAELLQTSQPRPIRTVAALALGEIGKKAEPAVPALIEQTNDWETDPRREAVRALGKIGRPAQAAVGALQECLLDSNAEIRGLAALALGQVGPEQPASAQALQPLRADPAVQVRFAALQALHRCAPDSKQETAAQLRDLAHALDPSVHIPALEGLAEVDADAARELAGILQGDLTLEDAGLRARAGKLLLTLQPRRSRHTVLALARLLGSPIPVVRRDILNVLADAGSKARPAVPWIVPLLHDPEQQIRDAARRALPGIDRQAAIQAGVL